MLFKSKTPKRYLNKSRPLREILGNPRPKTVKKMDGTKTMLKFNLKRIKSGHEKCPFWDEEEISSEMNSLQRRNLERR